MKKLTFILLIALSVISCQNAEEKLQNEKIKNLEGVWKGELPGLPTSVLTWTIKHFNGDRFEIEIVVKDESSPDTVRNESIIITNERYHEIFKDKNTLVLRHGYTGKQYELKRQ